jgi:hypothetical protein|eukprot:COSAG01_NODE_14610_length_1432_cov_3.937734_2_plen_57_part_00
MAALGWKALLPTLVGVGIVAYYVAPVHEQTGAVHEPVVAFVCVWGAVFGLLAVALW